MLLNWWLTFELRRKILTLDYCYGVLQSLLVCDNQNMDKLWCCDIYGAPICHSPDYKLATFLDTWSNNHSKADSRPNSAFSVASCRIIYRESEKNHCDSDPSRWRVWALWRVEEIYELLKGVSVDSYYVVLTMNLFYSIFNLKSELHYTTFISFNFILNVLQAIESKKRYFPETDHESPEKAIDRFLNNHLFSRLSDDSTVLSPCSLLNDLSDIQLILLFDKFNTRSLRVRWKWRLVMIDSWFDDISLKEGNNCKLRL